MRFRSACSQAAMAGKNCNKPAPIASTRTRPICCGISTRSGCGWTPNDHDLVPMLRLAGKVTIVTGSSSGIGKAIALRFGAEGAKVVVTARRIGLCERTVDQITKAGGEAWAVQTDVTDERQVRQLVEQTVTRYGRLDVLVNNAGMVAGGPLAETTTKAFDDVMNVNLRGTFFCCRTGFTQMKQQGGG